MTELLPSSASAAASPHAELPARSRLVTLSGVIVALVPSALLAAVLLATPNNAPIWSMLKRGDIGGIVGVDAFLAVLALVTLAGIAIVNRWRGWRIYAGTLGWLFIYMSNFLVMEYLQSREFAPYAATSGVSPTPIIIAAAAALLGILLLVGKRDEPPPLPARPMTAIGITIMVIGIASFAAAVIYARDLLTAAAPAAIGVILAVVGVDVVKRYRGWRIYSGGLAWFLIVTGVIGFFTNMPSPHDPRWMSRGWMNASTVAACIGIGYFILWSKRREPRPAPKQKDAARAA